MTLNFNAIVSAPRAVQLVAGGIALYGGWKVGSSIVRNAYREDLLGDPTRVVEIDGKTMIYQTREPQGDKLTKYMVGAGAASAFAGGALLAKASMGATTGMKGLLMQGGGAALVALGLGAVAGATALWSDMSGSDFVPVR